MSDAFERIVLDDADPIEALGAVRWSQARAQNLDDSLAIAFAALDEFQDELGITDDDQRARNRAKVEARVIEYIELSFEKLKLRLLGQEPVH